MVDPCAYIEQAHGIQGYSSDGAFHVAKIYVWCRMPDFCSVGFFSQIGHIIRLTIVL